MSNRMRADIGLCTAGCPLWPANRRGTENPLETRRASLGLHGMRLTLPHDHLRVEDDGVRRSQDGRGGGPPGVLRHEALLGGLLVGVEEREGTVRVGRAGTASIVHKWDVSAGDHKAREVTSRLTRSPAKSGKQGRAHLSAAVYENPGPPSLPFSSLALGQGCLCKDASAVAYRSE
jgi:hypothetical protein